MISQRDDHNEEAQILGDKIKQARRQAGLSQRELGEALQLSDKAISAYEQGRAMPNLAQLRTLSKTVQQPVTYFIEPVEIDTPQTRLKDEVGAMRDDLNDVKRQLDKELKEIKQALQALGQ